MLLTSITLLSLVLLQGETPELHFIDMTAEERLEWIIDQASAYEMQTQEGADPLHREKPVLRFNDNVSGVVDAVLFVWTLEGRPEAAASFWYRKDGLKAHEFVSLSRGGIEAERDGDVAWDPGDAGVNFKALPDAPVPADTAIRRLTQMRRLAGRFTASVKRRAGDLQLRLMPQPMIRYEPKQEEIVDGAVFSFAKGTNPEVLLVIEAVKTQRGDLRFEYSPARMTSAAVGLSLDGEETWSMTKESGYARSGTYRNLYERSPPVPSSN
jgi:hypothetical protein